MNSTGISLDAVSFFSGLIDDVRIIKELSIKFQSMQLNSQQQKAAEYDGHVLVLAVGLARLV
ncbi:hypothetical protein ES703_20483 [subsurface metagenome]